MTDPLAFDAGNLALDFLNTRRGGGGRTQDALSSPASMLEWLAAAELLTDHQLRRLRSSPPDVRILLAEAQRLRREIRRAVEAMTEARLIPETSLLAMNRALEARRTSLRLAPAPPGRGGMVLVETPDGGPVRSVLSPVAEAGARLIVDGNRARIRRCHADDCRNWFVDTSKNGRRKWCSMQRCGNRAKVAAHYRRQREGITPG